MFDLKVVLPEEIALKVQAHCALGVRKGRSPDFPRVGCGNEELVTKIVLRTIIWMDTPEKIEERKRLSHQTLAWVVAAETFNLTRENFSWTTVCKTIENAGKAQVAKGMIDLLAKDHAYAVFVLGYGSLQYEPNVKSMMSNLAKAILWAEAYTFLVEEGYDYNEDRF
jgi:hypothetical protein